MSIVSIRNNLNALSCELECSNPGLLLERYVGKQINSSATDAERKEREAFWKLVADYSISDVYKLAYERWEKLMGKPNTIGMTVTDRLIVGLGAESVLETSITMNRVYGVPMIPGSALKGLARKYYMEMADVVENKISVDQNCKILFGDQDSAGYITFLDAWYIPNDDKPLRVDVITPHHQKYYTSKGQDSLPTDFDDPNPVSFISAVGKYLLAVKGSDKDWNNVAIDILKHALADYGVGGKTSSGYGRLTLDGTFKTSPLNSANKQMTHSPLDLAVPVRRIIESLRNKGDISRLTGIISQIEEISDIGIRVELAQLIQDKLISWKVWNNAKYSDKEWYIGLITLLGDS